MEGRLRANLASRKMSKLLEEADQGGGKVVTSSILTDPSISSIAQHQTAGLSKVFHHDDTPSTASTLANQIGGSRSGKVNQQDKEISQKMNADPPHPSEPLKLRLDISSVEKSLFTTNLQDLEEGEIEMHFINSHSSPLPSLQQQHLATPSGRTSSELLQNANTRSPVHDQQSSKNKKKEGNSQEGNLAQGMVYNLSKHPSGGSSLQILPRYPLPAPSLSDFRVVSLPISVHPVQRSVGKNGVPIKGVDQFDRRNEDAGAMDAILGEISVGIPVQRNPESRTESIHGCLSSKWVDPCSMDSERHPSERELHINVNGSANGRRVRRVLNEARNWVPRLPDQSDTKTDMGEGYQFFQFESSDEGEDVQMSFDDSVSVG
ncbi:uncharacterized protein G2W53_033556 [Senna tora]|uniref:Uncharacterized protein n=1 Tax=Senna tora TaxID=362788 RepID=A0A834T0S5_9FABA|nr:uncharacterized protein G2W53_033556 [Senna tora]